MGISSRGMPSSEIVGWPGALCVRRVEEEECARESPDMVRASWLYLHRFARWEELVDSAPEESSLASEPLLGVSECLRFMLCANQGCVAGQADEKVVIVKGRYMRSSVEVTGKIHALPDRARTF